MKRLLGDSEYYLQQAEYWIETAKIYLSLGDEYTSSYDNSIKIALSYHKKYEKTIRKFNRVEKKMKVKDIL